ncbi:MAG: (2Fe-2S) ferredoxin domain-containing protein [Bacillota bacterium]
MATWNLSGTKHHLLLCNGGSCMLRHAEEVTQAIRNEIALHNADSLIHTTRTLCNGRCNDAFTVVLYPQGIWYRNLTPSLGRELIRRLLDEKLPLLEQISYTYQHQQFVATGRAAVGEFKQPN